MIFNVKNFQFLFRIMALKCIDDIPSTPVDCENMATVHIVDEHLSIFLYHVDVQ